MHYAWMLLVSTLLTGSASAQLPDSVITTPSDSVAIRTFAARYGPAEGVVLPFLPPAYRFKTGVYSLTSPAFPLRQSPDSSVRQPIKLAFRQERVVRITRLATVVPLALLTYSAVRLVLALGSVATGQKTNLDHVGPLVYVGGIGSLAGMTVSGTFTIASLINLRKGIKRHNRLFGRRVPTLFNPKGL